MTSSYRYYMAKHESELLFKCTIQNGGAFIHTGQAQPSVIRRVFDYPFFLQFGLFSHCMKGCVCSDAHEHDYMCFPAGGA